MDNLLQMKILGKDTKSLYIPTAIQKLVINTEKHFETFEKLNKENPGNEKSVDIWTTYL